MKTENKVLLQQARAALTGKWRIAILTFLLYMAITGSCGARRELFVVSMVPGGPMALGAAYFSLAIAHGQEARLEQMFNGFRPFSKALSTYLLMLLYVVLWLLLLIVPGIIVALSYSMSFYILADDPSLSPQQVLDRSKAMMDGYKAKLFALCLWFFLLALLCILTPGIGFLWLIPYANVTMARFYDDVKVTDFKWSFENR